VAINAEDVVFDDEKGHGATILKFRPVTDARSQPASYSHERAGTRPAVRRETYPPRDAGDRITSCECGRRRDH
jgi:hypothetical protein